MISRHGRCGTKSHTTEEPGGGRAGRPKAARGTALLLAGLLPFAGSVTGPAQATDGGAAAVGTAAAAAPSGCWMVASDGGIFSFGDARFYGSTGAIKLNQPITAVGVTPDGGGYWLMATDGGLFSYGDATFYGSLSGQPDAGRVVGFVPNWDGAGYWEINSAGNATPFGDATDFGPAPSGVTDIVGAVAMPTGAGLPVDPTAQTPPDSPDATGETLPQTSGVGGTFTPGSLPPG